MKTVRHRLPALGALIGLLPLLLHLVLTWSGTPHVSAPPYLLWAPLAIMVPFSVSWHRDVRAQADEASTARSLLLWAPLGLSAMAVAIAFSHMSGYAEVELFSGERYRLMPTVVTAAAVGGSQMLIAATALMLDHREHGVPGGGVALFLVAVLVLVIPAGVGVLAEGAVRPSPPGLEHFTTSTEPLSRGIPNQVEGTPTALDIPEDAVRAVEAIAPGVLFRLADGVVAVDPLSGVELWRYRSPGADTRTLVAADGASLVVEEYRPSSDNDTRPATVRVTLNALTGQILHRSEDEQRLLEDEISPVENDAQNAEPWEGESVVVRTKARALLEVYGASSGALLWTFDGSPDCVPNGEDSILDLEITPDLVLAAVLCRGGAAPVLYAFDTDTGESLWTHNIIAQDGPAGSAIAVSSDGSSLFRYDVHSGSYFTIDTRTGEELSSGTWKDPRPSGERLKQHLWEEVVGDGVLLGSDPVLTLTDADGEPAHTVELPPTDGQRSLTATDEELYTISWPKNNDRAVELTVHPWNGAPSRTVENILGRELSEGEWAGMRVVPGAVIVYAVSSGTINTAVAVT